MPSAEFADVVAEIVAIAPPSRGHDLSGMLEDFHAYLWRVAGLDQESLTVRSTGDPTMLIHAEGRLIPGTDPTAVAKSLESIWINDLRYRYRESHLLVASTTGVQLRCITQIDAASFYVTAQIDLRA